MYRRAATGIVFHTPSTHGEFVRHRFQWTSDSSGDAVFYVVGVTGSPVAVEWKNTDAAGETYTVTLEDDLTEDWLTGLVSAVQTGTSGRESLIDATVPAPLPGTLWFVVNCSAAAVRSGVVDIWTRGV